MSDSPFSVYAPDKTLNSEALRSTSFYAFDPGMSAVVGSFMHEAFTGTGTMAEALRRTQVDFERGELKVRGPVSLYRSIETKLNGDEPSERISFEDWQNSKYYRNGLQYSPGMTVEAARILSEEKDRLDKQSLIMGRASGVEKAIGITGAFVGGIFEPRNLAAGIGAAVALGGVHGAVVSRGKAVADAASRAKKLEKVIGKAGTVKRAAVEGLVGAAVLEPGNFEAASSLQKDYAMSDTLWNVGLSVGASGFIQGGVNFFGGRRARRLARGEGVDASMVAISQAGSGKKIDTSIVHDYYDSLMQQERPPTEFSPEELKRLASEPDTTGIHDYFWNEARSINDKLDQLSSADLRNKTFVAKALGVEAKDLRSVTQIIKDLGGIVDVAGELRSRGITNKSSPGLIRRSKQDITEAGEIDISKAGRSPEDFIRALKEKGFFSDKDEASITKDDVLDLIEADLLSDRRVFPDAQMAQIEELVGPANEALRAYDEAGIGVGDTEEAVARKLQQYYADNELPFGEVYPELTSDELARLKTPDALMSDYEKSYEAWREIDLYDDTNPAEYMFEASQIKDVDNELKDIQKSIEALEDELASGREAGLLSSEDEKALDLINETVETMDDMKTAIKQGMFCLTR